MHKQRSHEVFYQFKVWLLDSPLPIWRRFLLRSDMPLNMLHEVTQIAMGWWEFHEYEFQVAGRRFSDEEEKLAPGVESDLDTRLCDVVSEPGDKIHYVYNFAANWQHEIVLEGITPMEPSTKVGRPFAYCFGGKRACPPEKINGVAEYREFVNAIEDPNHSNREKMLGLINYAFDPDAFDVGQVNIRLLVMDAEFSFYEKELIARKKRNKLVVLKPRAGKSR